MWVCNARHDCKTECKTPRLPPDMIHYVFIRAYNNTMINTQSIISDYKDIGFILNNRIPISEVFPLCLEQWEPRIFSHSVEYIKIYSNNTALVAFKNGKSINLEIYYKQLPCSINKN